MIRFNTMILMFALALSSFANDGEKLVITADDAVATAIANNLGLAVERVGLSIKERTKNTNWNVFIPRVSASSSFSRPNEPVPPLVPDRFTLSTSLNATLVLSVQLFLSMKQTVLDWESGKISYESAEKKLDRDVRKNFYSLLLMEQSIRLMEKNILSAKTRFDTATANYNNGLVDQYTMLAAQVGLENMKPALDELSNNYTTALLAFKLLIGVPLDRDIHLNGSLEEVKSFSFDDRKLIDSYLPKRFDLQSMQYSVMMLENARDIAWSALYPSLSLMLSFDPTFMNDPFTAPWFDDIENDWKQRSGMFGITLSVSVDSLLPFSKAQVDAVNAQANLEKMKLSFKQAEMAAELEVRSIVLRLKKSGESLRTLALNVSLAEKANAMGQEAYRAGLKDYSQIETTEYELQNAQFNILKEKFNYISGLYDLAFALNTSLDGLKETTNE